MQEVDQRFSIQKQSGDTSIHVSCDENHLCNKKCIIVKQRKQSRNLVMQYEESNRYHSPFLSFFIWGVGCRGEGWAGSRTRLA